MHSKGDNIEIVINDEANFLIRLKVDNKIKQNRRKVVTFSSIIFIYCTKKFT